MHVPRAGALARGARDGVVEQGDGRELLAPGQVAEERRARELAGRETRGDPRPLPRLGRAPERQQPRPLDELVVASGGRIQPGCEVAVHEEEARLAVVALQGKRIFVTGGAGFIGTTLARRLVDENEVVAVDNLHRDALSGTDLGEHPNFTLHTVDVLDADVVRRARAGAPRTSSTAPRSPASTPCSRARCGRCA